MRLSHLPRALLGLGLFLLGGCDDDGTASGGGGSTGQTSPTTTGTVGEGGAGGEVIDPRFYPLMEALEAEMAELDTSGAAIAILEGGDVTFAKGFGKKHPQQDAPVLPTTLFRIGSTQKMMTAAAVLQLVQGGQIDLDEPIATYLPELELALGPTWVDDITVKHLLTHQSAQYDYLRIDTNLVGDDALHKWTHGYWSNHCYLMAPSGRMWNYSNPGFMMAGLVAEKTAGVPYRTYMAENVWGPLGMSRTYSLPSDVLADGDYASGDTWHWESGEKMVAGPDSYDNGWARPAGFAFSSVLDMAEFVKFLRAGNTGVLADDLRTQMFAEQVDTELLPDIGFYGFGLEVHRGIFLHGETGEELDYYEVPRISHAGALHGFSADVYYFPSVDFGLITLANADGAYFQKTLEVALETLVELPAPSTPPDMTVDPADYPLFVGDYEDPWNVGTISVTTDGTDLRIAIELADQYDIPYDPVLEPYTPNNFLLTIDGVTLPVTFLFDDPESAKYLRTRFFVGVREAAMLAAAPTDAERLASLFAGLEEARRDRPVTMLGPKPRR